MRLWMKRAIMFFGTCFFYSCCYAGLLEDGKNDARATYYYPPKSGSEWLTKDADILGWDTTKLSEAYRYLQASNSKGFIILHKGKSVIEKYWGGWDKDTRNSIFSVFKSMMGFIIGQYQQQNKLNLEDQVSLYVGSGWSHVSPEQEAKIKIKHLLTMTSGLNKLLYYNAELDTTWLYNTHAFNVLTKVLTAISGKTMMEIADEMLFSPIGMQPDKYDSCSVRDMARFGLLVLSGGWWEETPVFDDPAYITHMLNTSQSFNLSYGYLWWLNGKSSHRSSYRISLFNNVIQGPIVPAGPQKMVVARGIGDKRIYIIPDEDLIVVRHGSIASFNFNGFDQGLWRRLSLVIYPATTPEKTAAFTPMEQIQD